MEMVPSIRIIQTVFVLLVLVGLRAARSLQTVVAVSCTINTEVFSRTDTDHCLISSC
jgi:hypothetical protein